MTTAQDGGKVVSLTHRPTLPPRKYTWYSFLLEPRQAITWQKFVPSKVFRKLLPRIVQKVTATYCPESYCHVLFRKLLPRIVQKVTATYCSESYCHVLFRKLLPHIVQKVTATYFSESYCHVLF